MTKAIQLPLLNSYSLPAKTAVWIEGDKTCRSPNLPPDQRVLMHIHDFSAETTEFSFSEGALTQPSGKWLLRLIPQIEIQN